MVHCEECRKKLGIFQGYKHPALGKRFLVCWKCHKKIDGDMKRWSKFCCSDTFNAESSKNTIQEAWNKSISNDIPMQKWFNTIWIKMENNRHQKKRI